MDVSLATLGRGALLLVGLAAAAPAQAPSSFAELRLPPGVSPAAATQRGKILFLHGAGKVHVFSAFTRDWRALDAGPGAVLRQANDWLLVQEGGAWTAFSSMRGTFEPLAVSGGARVLNSPTQGNDAIALIQDGGTLHAFSGLVGQWVPLPATLSGTAWVAVQRNVALVVDGGDAWAMGAASGRWIRQPITGTPTRVHADGSAGVVETTAGIWGFSAQRERWTPFQALPGADFEAGGDVAVWHDGIVCVGYSGVRGRFDGVAPGTDVQVRIEQQLAVAQAGLRSWLFSASLGRWTMTVTATPASVTAGGAVALLATPLEVVAYSAVLGTVASLPGTPAFVASSWAVAVVTDGLGMNHFFSAYTGQWADAPPGPPTAAAQVAFNLGAIDTHAGVAAFSARSGRFVELVTPSGGQARLNERSAVLAVVEPDRFSVFDARRDAWLSVPRVGGGTLGVSIWRTTLLAQEGLRFYGFGAQHGALETFDVSTTPNTIDARSESGRIELASSVVGYSAAPDLTTLGQFPEFRRMQARGAPLDLLVHGPEGAAVLALIGFPAANGIPTSLGTLLLDLTRPAVPLPMGVLPTGGSLGLRLTTPRTISVIGTELAFQGVVVPVAAGAYLTRMCTALIH